MVVSVPMNGVTAGYVVAWDIPTCRMSDSMENGVVCAGTGIMMKKIAGSALTAGRNDVRRISRLPIGGSTQSAKGRSVRGVGGAWCTARTRTRTIKKMIKSLTMKIGRFYFLLHL